MHMEKSKSVHGYFYHQIQDGYSASCILCSQNWKEVQTFQLLNWAFKILKGRLKSHINKYRIKEKLGCSSYSVFALVIATGPVAEEQFSLLVLMLLFFSVLV